MSIVWEEDWEMNRAGCTSAALQNIAGRGHYEKLKLKLNMLI